jgi:Rrf2 family protein
VQILLQLKGAGFVASTRGASGGYQLIKSPDDISLGQVMTVIEGDESGAVSSATTGTGATSRVLRSAWQEVAQAQRETLNAITFGDLVSRVKRQTENMYYI